MTHTISLVVIHKGVEVVVVQIGSPISELSIGLGKWVDRAVIDHVSWGIASSTDPKVTNLISMSPPITDITLDCQTMMGSMTRRCFLTGRAEIHGTEEPMVTEIHTNVAVGGGGAGARMLDKDLRGGGRDPLPFLNLDADDIIIIYGGGSRCSGMGGNLKGQGKGGGRVVDFCLSMVVLLFCSNEGEVDLLECWVKDFAWELLQVAVKGMDVE